MIDHSEALKELQDFSATFEPKLLDFPGIEKPIYAKPLSGAEMDAVNKYSGHNYNARIILAACINEGGKKTFMETDLADLQRLPAGILGQVAFQISNHVATNFDAVKKGSSAKSVGRFRRIGGAAKEKSS